MARSTVNRGMAQKIREGIQRNLKAAAIEIESITERSLKRGGRSGETYPVPGTARSYQASAPGEPPANRTGNYADSFRGRNQVIDLRAYIGTRDRRGRPLELGTFKMAPRPHLRPAAMNNLERIKRVMRRPVL